MTMSVLYLYQLRQEKTLLSTLYINMNQNSAIDLKWAFSLFHFHLNIYGIQIFSNCLENSEKCENKTAQKNNGLQCMGFQPQRAYRQI